MSMIEIERLVGSLLTTLPTVEAVLSGEQAMLHAWGTTLTGRHRR